MTKLRTGMIAVLLAIFLALFPSCGGSDEAGVTPPKKVVLAEGGTWGSSGGELIKDTQNPWWVENTTAVNYCVDFDASGMSTTRDHARAIIAQVIQNWTAEFARFYDPAWSGPLMRGKKKIKLRDGTISTGIVTGVGMQTFTEVECSGAEDLRFKLGYGTLTPEDLANLPNPREYVSMAVRTDYDEVNLRGRGFIFVGSDVGPNAIDRTGDQLDASPWSYDIVLYGVLAHELGHVFGLPHIGNRFESVMSAEFPELLVMKIYQFLLANLTIGDKLSFFVPPSKQTFCYDSSDLTDVDYLHAKAFFNFPDGNICIRISAINNWSGGMDIASAPTSSGPWTDAGQATVDPQSDSYSYVSSAFAVLLWLGPKQTVIDPSKVVAFSNFAIGPMILNLQEYGGTYRSARGTQAPVPVSFSVGPDVAEISGVLGGSIMPVLRIGF